MAQRETEKAAADPSRQIVLVTSRFSEPRPDFLLLQEFERACLAHSDWQVGRGPVLFRPTKISTRFYTLFHSCFRLFDRGGNPHRAVISLGLPYRHYFFGKTFPYFTLGSGLRVMWTYDVWQPQLERIAAIAKEAHLDLLLVSSAQAADLLQPLVPPTCEVRWVPEVVDVESYQGRTWSERSIDVLAFGRSHPRYHTAIAAGCEAYGLRYVFHRFATAAEFVRALGDSKISICFPRSVTHPEVAGGISTVTLRYLQSMAAKCLIIGDSPADAVPMFGYDPVIGVDWADPVGQLQRLLEDGDSATEIVDKNYATVAAHHQTRNFVERVNEMVKAAGGAVQRQ